MVLENARENPEEEDTQDGCFPKCPRAPRSTSENRLQTGWKHFIADLRAD